MRITTVNIPEHYIEKIDKLCGSENLFPSRSELIRCAVRDHLIRVINKLREGKEKEEEDSEQDEKDEEDDDIIRIPSEDGFKIYHVIRRLL